MGSWMLPGMALRGGVDEQRDIRQCYAMSGLPTINELSEIFLLRDMSQVHEINRTALSVILHRYPSQANALGMAGTAQSTTLQPAQPTASLPRGPTSPPDMIA